MITLILNALSLIMGRVIKIKPDNLLVQGKRAVGKIHGGAFTDSMTGHVGFRCDPAIQKHKQAIERQNKRAIQRTNKTHTTETHTVSGRHFVGRAVGSANGMQSTYMLLLVSRELFLLSGMGRNIGRAVGPPLIIVLILFMRRPRCALRSQNLDQSISRILFSYNHDQTHRAVRGREQPSRSDARC
jgi:hypothetical protein